MHIPSNWESVGKRSNIFLENGALFKDSMVLNLLNGIPSEVKMDLKVKASIVFSKTLWVKPDGGNWLRPTSKLKAKQRGTHCIDRTSAGKKSVGSNTIFWHILLKSLEKELTRIGLRENLRTFSGVARAFLNWV